ncbi:MAG TPA: universal stress protein [Thermoleophilaceae bacterium]|nr:universal stress protein [Thermoleophilaceae bacterium]
MSRPLLICFDDSEESRQAIAAAGRLFPGARATVLHLWWSLESSRAYRYSLAGATGALSQQLDELEAGGREYAERTAEHGVELAREAGLDAEALALEVEDEPYELVDQVADDLDADVVIVGSRGLGPIQSMALGGFSRAVVHHCRRPVLVVPGSRDD